MASISKAEIENFRKNMTIFRRLAGWSVPEFAEMVDLSRQTISGIESKRNSMSCVQYIAFRSLFEREAMRQYQEGNKVLLKSMSVLLSDKKVDEEMAEQMQTVAAAKAGGATKKQLNALIEILIPATLHLITLAAFLDIVLNSDE